MIKAFWTPILWRMCWTKNDQNRTSTVSLCRDVEFLLSSCSEPIVNPGFPWFPHNDTPHIHTQEKNCELTHLQMCIGGTPLFFPAPFRFLLKFSCGAVSALPYQFVEGLVRGMHVVEVIGSLWNLCTSFMSSTCSVKMLSVRPRFAWQTCLLIQVAH